MKRSVFFAFSLSAMAACTSANEPVGLQSSALTADQCSYFAVNGKVQICHATISAQNPFVIIKTDDAGCINGHEDHADDYIAYNDPTCKGLGCFPEGAPWDGTVECCEGLEARDGKCVQAGPCGNADDGAFCDDGNQCTVKDSCKAGQCVGYPDGYAACDDGNQCTVKDSCTKAGQCVGYSNDGAFCDDGNQCTVKDSCKAGQCVGYSNDDAACAGG